MSRYIFLATLTTVTLCLTSLLYAHGGGVDKQGCHTNAQTGQRHCHQAKPAKATTGPDAIIEVPASNATSFVGGNNKLTIEIQKELIRHGYLPGNTIGYADPKTIMAIKFFQEDIELEPNGERTQELLRLLRIYKP